MVTVRQQSANRDAAGREEKIVEEGDWGVRSTTWPRARPASRLSHCGTISDIKSKIVAIDKSVRLLGLRCLRAERGTGSGERKCGHACTECSAW